MKANVNNVKVSLDGIKKRLADIKKLREGIEGRINAVKEDFSKFHAQNYTSIFLLYNKTRQVLAFFFFLYIVMVYNVGLKFQIIAKF